MRTKKLARKLAGKSMDRSAGRSAGKSAHPSEGNPAPAVPHPGLSARVHKIRKMTRAGSTVQWQELACTRLALILKAADEFPSLKRRVKRRVKKPWQVEVELVGKAMMSRVNFIYRKKNYPTDVLSFPAPPPFVEQGMLGELMICLPVLKAQAQEIKSSPECELDVLLVHGVLHLLGFDHERGPKEARVMAGWEARLLGSVSQQAKTKKFQTGLGLIERSNSDKEST